jgi:hypothetical protein
MLATRSASATCLLAFAVLAGHASAQTALWPEIPAKAKKFACAPTTLRITMSAPHPHELGVWTPTRKFVLLHQCAENRPMDECKEFTQVATVDVRTGVIKLPVFGYAEKQDVRLFSSKGWYTFLLSANLETENNARTINRCRVYFSGAKPN